MNSISVHYDDTWFKFMKKEFQSDYFNTISTFINNEKSKGKTIFPPREFILNAFKLTPLDNVKVVILGQDPYHNTGQAHGLSFSVPKNVKTPPSLQNIYKEIKADLGYEIPNHGNLTNWAEQGVLLLNAVLTVNAHEPASHKKAGWETFTDNVIKYLSEHKTHVVFMLWGSFAQQKEYLIDHKKHLVLKAAHPSPFSAHRGFFGCKHFSKANDYLKQNGLSTINWSI
ncbi:MAG: uracil-DNA glycosylase [Bacteroidetes bacterium]|nr:uracil-DNA glycosylase [Bacteroidota bacterium]MCB9227530.1 uracil-DNA glycosylase [Chitinophagales bacterium]